MTSVAKTRSFAVLACALLAFLASALAAPGTAPSAGTCSSPPVTPYGPCGMDLEDAWSHYTTGDPSEVVAYIEGGINWHISQAKELVDSIYVNWHELPVPCTGSTMVVGGETQSCHTVYSSSFADYDVEPRRRGQRRRLGQRSARARRQRQRLHRPRGSDRRVLRRRRPRPRRLRQRHLRLGLLRQPERPRPPKTPPTTTPTTRCS